MKSAIRQKMLVKAGGKLEISSPELPEGALVEVRVFLLPKEEPDTTEYLLSTEANRQKLYRESFLTGLSTAQQEVETGQFEEVKTFDDFIR
ncbi:MAG: hypothetical protein BWK78_09860 [Thiotrichaceae bacterium IS1]|nr:MAG: hypothetical protein BWK78_09860 [Thiotrichaceae bacterium IS1]